MKFKKSMLILILAVFLLSIAGVCASDVNDTQMASQENAAIESTDENLITVEDIEPAVSTAENEEIVSAGVDDEIVGVENDLDELSANSAKFSDLVREIGAGGNIKLQHDYYTYDSGIVSITQSNSVIDGNGAIIDMAGTSTFAFYVDYHALGVTIKNLTIKNSGGQEGSGVYAWSPCTIENCSFINNQAWDNGGAVFFRTSGKVINCYFESNRVTGSNGTGGAVYFGGSGEVINCSFNGNNATYGGALYFDQGDNKVRNCNFVNNTAGDYGGALINYGTGIVGNCNFVNNTAGDHAGALVIFKKANVTNSNFTNNQAPYGGAAWFNGDATVENCIFVNNHADNTAGGLFISEGVVLSCNFVNNTAVDYGGAVFFNKTAELTNCNFTNNSAENDGGAVYFRTDGSVTNCNFTNNFAEYAGAVSFRADGNVRNCYFVNNSASTDAGAIQLAGTGNVIDCIFINNSASRLAGALIIKNGEVINCNFTNNMVDEYAGAILVSDSGNVTNCNFVNNTGTDAAAIEIVATGTVANCNFVDNTVTSWGGAIYFGGLFPGSIGTVTNCNFTNNAADRGGAIYFYPTGTAENCNFVNNSASHGAAIFFNDNGNVRNCYFVNNSASSYGGAMYFKGTRSTYAVEDCNFVNNSASLQGGAIRVSGNGTVENCNFDGNNATYGGAIFFKTNANVTSSNFNCNNASYGGAIYWDTSANGLVSGSVFVNNSADNATIYFNNGNDGSNFTINDNIFLNNDGVAIYFVNNDSTFNADYNWFGNNATNYNTEPITHNVQINTWLFLNATANPNAITVFGSSDIVFKLYAYTPSEVSEYDNSRLKAVNLTLTPTNGNVNITEVGLDEPVRFNPEDYGICKLTAKIENVEYTTTLEIADGTSFSDLNFVINGNDNDTIVLDRDYTYNPAFDSDLTEGIVINRPLTIVGNGHTLNAAGLARIFSIQANNVVIENVTFVNGKSDRHGGAIFWSGNKGKISDCIFVNNSADQQGAAINLDGDDSIVSGCTFVNNSADQQGAIYWSGDNGNVSGCSFVNNSASDGGALTFMGYKGSVSGCSFVNNSARLDGGAIYLDESDESIVSNCSFENNYANRQGGAISWRYTKDGIVSDCSFVNNSASDDGGAVYWSGDNGNVSSCSFVNNSANYGIIYFDNSFYDHLSVNDNIFLNNDGVAIYFVDTDSTSNADYNWFGNNATNYNIEPITNNVEISTWLFLNATANPDSISISESSDILFKLYSYNSNEVSDYDNSKLPAVNLTLTANNGDVNESTVSLGNPVEFTPNGAGSASVTAAIENAEYTVLLDVAKADSILSADDLVMTYKDGSAWNVTLTDNNGVAISGRVVKFGIKDKIYSIVTDENGVAGLPINLIPDTYAINATFEGDGDYGDSFVNATVTVIKAVASLSAVDLEMIYKDGSAWVVTLTDSNGDAIVGVKVAIGICNKTYHIKTDDAGAANLTINLLPGTYDVNASFSSSRYEAQTITATVTVNKLVPTLSAEDLVMNYNDGSAWNVTLKDAAGNIMAGTYVKFTIGNKTYNRKTNADGVASLPIGLAAGNYTITTEFTGTGTLDAVEITNTIVVNPPEYNLVANDINMTYQDGTNYTVQITDGEGNPVAKAGVIIKMTINGKSYNRKTNEVGIASLPIGLRAGTYTITAEYNGKEITNTIIIS